MNAHNLPLLLTLHWCTNFFSQFLCLINATWKWKRGKTAMKLCAEIEVHSLTQMHRAFHIKENWWALHRQVPRLNHNLNNPEIQIRVCRWGCCHMWPLPSSASHAAAGSWVRGSTDLQRGGSPGTERQPAARAPLLSGEGRFWSPGASGSKTHGSDKCGVSQCTPSEVMWGAAWMAAHATA